MSLHLMNKQPKPVVRSYIGKQKRHGCSISCSKCGAKSSVGGQRNEFKLDKIITNFITQHNKKCDGQLKIPRSHHATEIPHAFGSQTTQQTHTGDTNFTDIDSTDLKAAIDSTHFTTGRKYLILVSSVFGGSSATGLFEGQVVHGSTAFAESVQIFEPLGTSLPGGIQYTWLTVWTAIASEGIKLQYKTQTSGNTVRADNTVITSIEISEDLTENTDWFFDYNGTDQSLSTTFSTVNNASITFTPSGASKWLVLGYSRLEVGSVSVSGEVRINSSEDTPGTVPLIRREAENINEEMMLFLARASSLTNQSNTFTIQSREDSSSGYVRLDNAIFVINMDKFKNNDFTHTTGSNSLTTTPVSQASVTLTPTITGDVFALAYFVNDAGGSDNVDTAMITLEIDSTQDPASQKVVGNHPIDTTDQIENCIFTISNETNASHMWNCMGEDNGGTAVAQDRLMTVFTMELLLSTFTKTFTIDTQIANQFTKTFTIDTILQAQQTKTFTIDTVLQDTFTKTFTIDTVLQDTFTKTFTIDTQIANLDTQIANQFTKTFTIDTILQAQQTKTFTIDTQIANQFTKTFTIDTILQAQQTKTFTIDTQIANQFTKTFTIDTQIANQFTKTFTIDVSLRTSQNALILKDKDKNLRLNTK